MTTLPRWARLADALAITLLLLALSVACFGGFREHLGPLRISLTSWWRPAIWSAGLIVLRHVLVRFRPLHVRLRDVLSQARRSDVVSAAVPVFAATRIPILAVGLLAVLTVGYRPGEEERGRASRNEVANLLSRFDAAYYSGIARDGYTWNGNPRQEQTVVFFPAYPLLMRIGMHLLGGALFAAALVISLAAFFMALLYLYAFARSRLDEDQARASLAFLAAYPFAFFFSAAYAESLLLLGLVATFYHSERREWTSAGAWALLVGLTKPSGLFLAVPLAVVALQDLRRAGWRLQPSLLLPRLAVAAMPIVGTLIFCAYLQIEFGDPLAWLRGQAAWGRSYQGISAVFIDTFGAVSAHGFNEYIVSRPFDVLNAAAAFLALLALWPVTRTLGVQYGLLIAVSILPPLSAGGFLSVGRFTAVLFPIFLWLGLRIPAAHRTAWLSAFAMCQALCAALFFTWRPLY